MVRSVATGSANVAMSARGVESCGNSRGSKLISRKRLLLQRSVRSVATPSVVLLVSSTSPAGKARTISYRRRASTVHDPALVTVAGHRQRKPISRSVARNSKYPDTCDAIQTWVRIGNVLRLSATLWSYTKMGTSSSRLTRQRRTSGVVAVGGNGVGGVTTNRVDDADCSGGSAGGIDVPSYTNTTMVIDG